MTAAVVIGARHFSDEVGKTYPDLSLTLQHDVVRYLFEATKEARIDMRAQVILLRRLQDELEPAVAAALKKTGLPYPQGGFRSVLDDEIEPVTIVLNDIEQSILSYTMLRCLDSRKFGDYDYDEPHPISGIRRAIDRHIISNGGYDHSKSIDNLAWLHSESPRLLAYVAAGSVKPKAEDEAEPTPAQEKGWFRRLFSLWA